MRNLEPLSVEYWTEYKNRLEAFIIDYKKKCDKQPNYENVDFNYSVEFYNEKVATLEAEVDRVKTLLSVLRYKFNIDEC